MLPVWKAQGLWKSQADSKSSDKTAWNLAFADCTFYITGFLILSHSNNTSQIPFCTRNYKKNTDTGIKWLIF